MGVCGRAVPCEQGCVRQGVHGGRGGGAPANMEKNEEKKPHHDTWKARECGLLLSRMTNWTALCSASTCTRDRQRRERPLVGVGG